MDYEYLPHTADTKFRAYGKTLQEVFSNAALAVTNVMVDSRIISKRKTHHISAAGSDVQSLLVQFLEQLLILLDAELFFAHSVTRIAIHHRGKTYTAEADVIGDDAAKYETHGPQVKAITYNDMKVEETGKGWMVQVVVDI
jgi:SHS2 domain-containing protein